LSIFAGRAERIIPLQAKAASSGVEPVALVRVSTARHVRRPSPADAGRISLFRLNFNPSRKAH
jgi:hypothetical protein